jgi:RNA polymerase sigma-70 factor, ECF subfamily
MALHRLRDPDLAEDVVQETLSRALAVIREGKAGDIRDLGAFVHGIARHVILDCIRTRQRDAGAEPLRDTADPASLRDALSHVVSADERARVHAALERLTPADRRILHLSFFEGLSCAELAERLGLNALRIRKRKSRALERLRRVFLGDPAGHEDRGNTTASGERAPAPMQAPEVSA